MAHPKQEMLDAWRLSTAASTTTWVISGDSGIEREKRCRPNVAEGLRRFDELIIGNDLPRREAALQLRLHRSRVRRTKKS